VNRCSGVLSVPICQEQGRPGTRRDLLDVVSGRYIRLRYRRTAVLVPEARHELGNDHPPTLCKVDGVPLDGEAAGDVADVALANRATRRPNGLGDRLSLLGHPAAGGLKNRLPLLCQRARLPREASSGIGHSGCGCAQQGGSSGRARMLMRPDCPSPWPRR